MRASASYRMRAAQGLLERCLRSINGETTPQLFSDVEALEVPARG
jgi:hypothetical protein